MVNLSNGIYELTPVGETIVDEGPLNLTELNQDLDQRPQEPKASFDSAQEGKPRCIFPLLLHIFTFTHSISVVIILPAHLSS